MIIIFKSQQYWVQQDVILQVIMASTQVSPILVQKIDLGPGLLRNFHVKIHVS